MAYAFAEGDAHIEEIEADGYESDVMGDGDNAVPSVVFTREVPGPEDAGETLDMKVFELPAHSVRYIRNTGEMPEPDAPAKADSSEVTNGGAKDVPPHGGYPDPQNPGYGRTD